MDSRRMNENLESPRSPRDHSVRRNSPAGHGRADAVNAQTMQGIRPRGINASESCGVPRRVFALTLRAMASATLAGLLLRMIGSPLCEMLAEPMLRAGITNTGAPLAKREPSRFGGPRPNCRILMTPGFSSAMTVSRARGDHHGWGLLKGQVQGSWGQRGSKIHDLLGSTPSRHNGR